MASQELLYDLMISVGITSTDDGKFPQIRREVVDRHTDFPQVTDCGLEICYTLRKFETYVHILRLSVQAH